MLTKYKFFCLITIVFISGFAQGMLLPLIAILLEAHGTSARLNGLNATALYFGIIFASFFIEKPLRRYGYKPLILLGLLVVIFSFCLFPFWKAFWLWFVLRLLIGIGDHMLHFSTQVWITTKSADEKRGRNISLYGIAFGAGFGIGPLMTKLIAVNENLPFFLSAIVCLISFLLISTIKNDFTESETPREAGATTWEKYRGVMAISWIALLPPFGYGFLESTLNGSFPVFALRNGMGVNWIAVLLPSFVIGGLVFQYPLGILSDKFPKKTVLLWCLGLGLLFFALTGLATGHLWIYAALFFGAGMFCGSLFSLGMTYMSDLLPKSQIPAGNILAGIAYSVGSMAGPLMAGYLIDGMKKIGFLTAICGMLLLLFAVIAVYAAPKAKNTEIKNVSRQIL